MSTIGDRLRTARKAAGFKSASSAAHRMGTPVATFTSHENGHRAFGPKEADIYARFFGVRSSWLLLGEGGMLRDDVISRVPEGREFDPDPDFESSLGHGFSAVGPYVPSLPGARPEIDVKAGAGLGQVGDEAVVSVGGMSVSGHRVVAEWLLPDEFVRHTLSSEPGGILILEVYGDSMAPTLAPGDRVICDTRQNAFGADGIYVFDAGSGEPSIKRFERVLFQDPPRVRIISDNKAHSAQDVELDRIRFIGRATGRVSRM